MSRDIVCLPIDIECTVYIRVVRLSRIFKFRNIFTIVFLLGLPVLVFYKEVVALCIVTLLYASIAVLSHLYTEKIISYLSFVKGFREGWATYEVLNKKFVRVFFRGKSYDFRLFQASDVQDDQIHLLFYGRRCYVIPEVYEELIGQIQEKK